jgi:hypothetical protein
MAELMMLPWDEFLCELEEARRFEGDDRPR